MGDCVEIGEEIYSRLEDVLKTNSPDSTDHVFVKDIETSKTALPSSRVRNTKQQSSEPQPKEEHEHLAATTPQPINLETQLTHKPRKPPPAPSLPPPAPPPRPNNHVLPPPILALNHPLNIRQLDVLLDKHNDSGLVHADEGAFADDEGRGRRGGGGEGDEGAVVDGAGEGWAGGRGVGCGGGHRGLGGGELGMGMGMGEIGWMMDDRGGCWIYLDIPEYISECCN